MNTTLTLKLNPVRFSAISGKMAAIVGCILSERFTDPALVELAVTSDGFVLGRRENDCGLNEWIGDAATLSGTGRGRSTVPLNRPI